VLDGVGVGPGSGLHDDAETVVLEGFVSLDKAKLVASAAFATV